MILFYRRSSATAYRTGCPLGALSHRSAFGCFEFSYTLCVGFLAKKYMAMDACKSTSSLM